jgi:hypothetical protein
MKRTIKDRFPKREARALRRRAASALRAYRRMSKWRSPNGEYHYKGSIVAYTQYEVLKTIADWL